ncbi:MAG: acetate--CoA ligase family protein [Thermoanaerobaculia bacterium]
MSIADQTLSAAIPEKRSVGALDAIFRPRSVAIVGASRRRGAIGAEVLQNVVRSGFEGVVYPVNPTAQFVQSIRAYPTVTSIPDEVDLAVLCVPASLVPTVVDDCIEKKVRGLIILTAGFAEVGEGGRALQNEFVAKLRRNGIRLVGPNCLGVVNTDPEVRLNATFAPTWPPSGSVAFSSQSGALGVAILDYANELGIGVREFVSVGNKADVSGNDLLEYWEEDAAINTILLYLESFGNPKRFLEIARRISRKKPIAVVKSGRTGAGARAASSHTGALASKDVAVDALLEQAGVIRTDTIEELFDMAMLLANQPIPSGNRVAILTNGGGPGIMASDACEHRGLVLPELAPETVSSLRAFLPPEASVRNPVDMVASATASSYERGLRLLLHDPGIDAVIVLFVPPIMTEAAEVATAICRAAAESHQKKPVLTCLMGTHGIPPALSSLHEGKIPSYAFPEAAALALSRAVRHGEWLSIPPGEHRVFEVDLDRARRLVTPEGGASAAGTWLGSDRAGDLLTAYGVPILGSRFAPDVDAAVDAAEELGYPVALKLSSETIVHKSDVGGVVLNLKNEKDLRRGFERIRSSIEAHGYPPEAMAGAIVQQMAGAGVEIFVGMSRDPSFGPLIAFGLGGVNVEVWKDVVFRVAPITDRDAREMLERIRAAKLLDGFRGSRPADRDSIVEVLLRVSQMAIDLPSIQELDINPLLARVPGKGSVAVDARIRIG